MAHCMSCAHLLFITVPALLSSCALHNVQNQCPVMPILRHFPEM